MFPVDTAETLHTLDQGMDVNMNRYLTSLWLQGAVRRAVSVIIENISWPHQCLNCAFITDMNKHYQWAQALKMSARRVTRWCLRRLRGWRRDILPGLTADWCLQITANNPIGGRAGKGSCHCILCGGVKKTKNLDPHSTNHFPCGISLMPVIAPPLRGPNEQTLDLQIRDTHPHMQLLMGNSLALNHITLVGSTHFSDVRCAVRFGQHNNFHWWSQRVKSRY